MHGKHILTLLILNGREDARLVPNRIYFRMLSSLFRSKSMTTWTMTIHIGGNEKAYSIMARQVFCFQLHICILFAYFSQVLLS